MRGSEGRKSPSGVQGRSPGRGSGGRSPPEAEALSFTIANFDDIFIGFAHINEILQYTLSTKKQLMLANDL